jgi:hypothetical protein
MTLPERSSWSAVERREAPGSSQGPAAPGPPPPSKPWVPETRRAGGPVSAALWEPRKLPGASRRSIPSGETEKGQTGAERL